MPASAVTQVGSLRQRSISKSKAACSPRSSSPRSSVGTNGRTRPNTAARSASGVSHKRAASAMSQPSALTAAPRAETASATRAVMSTAETLQARRSRMRPTVCSNASPGLSLSRQMVTSRPCSGLQSALCGDFAPFIGEMPTWSGKMRRATSALAFALDNHHRRVRALGEQFEPVKRTRIGDVLPAPLLSSGLAVFPPCPGPELLLAVGLVVAADEAEPAAIRIAIGP